jgi:DNA end-binding protein Ku
MARTCGGIKRSGTDEPAHKNEIKMVLQLAQAKSAGYDLEAEKDAYVVAMQGLLAAEPVMDIMAALKASIAQTQAQREVAAPAKKAAAKKTAKRAAPKRAS